MKANQSKQKLNAAQYIAAVFSILAGLGGLLHGIGEVLQGNINELFLTLSQLLHQDSLLRL